MKASNVQGDAECRLSRTCTPVVQKMDVPERTRYLNLVDSSSGTTWSSIGINRSCKEEKRVERVYGKAEMYKRWGARSLGIESRPPKSVKALREAYASAFPSFPSRQKVAVFQPSASQPLASSSSPRPCEQPFLAKKWKVSFRHHHSTIHI